MSDTKAVIEKIFKEQKVKDSNGNSYPLNSNIEESEGNFIRDIILKNNYSNTIEIGCAFGLSSLYICDALQNSPNAKHTIIDPFQKTDWHGIGLKHLEEANVNFYQHIEEKSEFALPKLVEKEECFDFALIDGWHTLDHTLIDFFYLNRLIKPGGTIIIDDTGMLAIRKLVRYLINYPAYKVAGGVGNEQSSMRNFVESFKKLLRGGTYLVPKKMRKEIFSPEFLASDKDLGINSSMIALKKTEEDNRPWNWYEIF